MFQKIINGYIFYFLGQLFGGQLFDLFARETNLKKQSSVCLCCDVGNEHLGVDAFFGSYFDDDNSHFDLNRVPFEPKKERFLQIIFRLVELLYFL